MCPQQDVLSILDVLPTHPLFFFHFAFAQLLRYNLLPGAAGGQWEVLPALIIV